MKCRSGGIGRRAGFRCLWSQDRVGSSPISCILFYLSRENSHLFQAVSNSKFVSVGVQSPAARLEYNKMIPVSPENYRYSFQGISNIILGIAELFLALNFVEKR